MVVLKKAYFVLYFQLPVTVLLVIRSIFLWHECLTYAVRHVSWKTVQSVLLISAFKNNHIAEIKFQMNHGTFKVCFFVVVVLLFISLLCVLVSQMYIASY